MSAQSLDGDVGGLIEAVETRRRRLSSVKRALRQRESKLRTVSEHVRRTMTAGLLVSYVARRDRYLPGLSGEATAVRELFTGHMDPTVKDTGTRWMDAWFRKVAQLRVLGTVAGDLWHRAQRGYVDGR